MFMAFVGGAGGFSFVRMSRSLIFLGCLKATIGGSGMGFLNLLEMWRCFLATLDRLVSPGLYVTTNGVGCLCMGIQGLRVRQP